MENLRDIYDVYEIIDSYIPYEYNELKKDLKDYIDSIWNQAPEVRRSSDTYIPFANILIKYIPNISDLQPNDEKWKYNIKNIFEGNPILEYK